MRVAGTHHAGPLILLGISLPRGSPNLFQIQTLAELRVGEIRSEIVFRRLLLALDLLWRPHRLSRRELAGRGPVREPRPE